MDFFASNQEVLFEYIIFGIFCNFLSMLLAIIVSVFKALTLDEESRQILAAFSSTRTEIAKGNKTSKIIAKNLLFFLPMYLVWINAIFIYYLFTVPGRQGFILGMIKADEFSIIRLVYYHPIKPDDK